MSPLAPSRHGEDRTQKQDKVDHDEHGLRVASADAGDIRGGPGGGVAAMGGQGAVAPTGPAGLLRLEFLRRAPGVVSEAGGLGVGAVGGVG